MHFKHFIDFFPNPKGNIDEISGSSFWIRGKKLEISHFLVKYSHNAQRVNIFSYYYTQYGCMVKNAMLQKWFVMNC